MNKIYEHIRLVIPSWQKVGNRLIDLADRAGLEEDEYNLHLRNWTGWD